MSRDSTMSFEPFGKFRNRIVDDLDQEIEFTDRMKAIQILESKGEEEAKLFIKQKYSQISEKVIEENQKLKEEHLKICNKIDSETILIEETKQ